MPYLLFCGYTLTSLQAIMLSFLDKQGINPESIKCTVSSGTVQPDICYDKLKGQLRNWKQKLRHNQKKGHNLSCPTERGDILILDGDTQINTRN